MAQARWRLGLTGTNQSSNERLERQNYDVIGITPGRISREPLYIQMPIKDSAHLLIIHYVRKRRREGGGEKLQMKNISGD